MRLKTIFIACLSLTVPAPGRISSLLKMKSNDFLFALSFNIAKKNKPSFLY
jgi:hypothetical protein